MIVDLKLNHDNSFKWVVFLLKKLKSIQLNKLILAEFEKYKNSINQIKQAIAHIPVELKKIYEEYYLIDEMQTTFIMIVNF